MRTARRFAGAAALGGKLYVVGGQRIIGGNRHYPANIPDNNNNNHGHNNNGFNIHHGNHHGPNNNGHNNVHNNNNDLAVAGENLLTSMEVFDGETGTWKDGPPIRTPVTRPSVCVLNGQLYVIGKPPDLNSI